MSIITCSPNSWFLNAHIVFEDTTDMLIGPLIAWLRTIRSIRIGQLRPWLTRWADPVDNSVTTSSLARAMSLIYAGWLGLSSPNSAGLQAGPPLSLGTSKQISLPYPCRSAGDLIEHMKWTEADHGPSNHRRWTDRHPGNFI
ncbi:hypothetical protein ACVSQB_33815 [Bradyrhizobium elkanii]